MGVTRARADALAHLAVLIEGLAAVERILGRPVERAGSSLPASFESALADLGRAVEGALAEAARAIEEDRAPKGFAQELERELLRLENEAWLARLDEATA